GGRITVSGGMLSILDAGKSKLGLNSGVALRSPLVVQSNGDKPGTLAIQGVLTVLNNVVLKFRGSPQARCRVMGMGKTVCAIIDGGTVVGGLRRSFFCDNCYTIFSNLGDQRTKLPGIRQNAAVSSIDRAPVRYDHCEFDGCYSTPTVQLDSSYTRSQVDFAF